VVEDAFGWPHIRLIETSDGRTVDQIESYNRIEAGSAELVTGEILDYIDGWLWQHLPLRLGLVVT
jgi:hypothetical protein